MTVIRRTPVVLLSGWMCAWRQFSGGGEPALVVEVVGRRVP